LKSQRKPYFAKIDEKCKKTTDYLYNSAQNDQFFARFGQN
jgi:hypothetical protein